MKGHDIRLDEVGLGDMYARTLNLLRGEVNACDREPIGETVGDGDPSATSDVEDAGSRAKGSCKKIQARRRLSVAYLVVAL